MITETTTQPRVVASNIDTWENSVILHDFPLELAERLDELKQMAQEADDDVPTPYTFAGQTLFLKPHGSQRQWRYILHGPSLHLEVGLGKRNHIVGKARLASVYLWEVGPGTALTTLYGFLVGFYGTQEFRLQVKEVHLCADIAGWEPSLADAAAFITRGHKKSGHVEEPSDNDEADEANALESAPGFEVHLDGRRCTGFTFSTGAAHSCCLYDKTKELAKSRKEWMRAIWERNGWDGESRVARVEFRYKRECLHQMGIEEPYEMLDHLAGMWAYSTAQWLRHTVPTYDTNRGRWLISPFWQAVQQAAFFGEGDPIVRERKRAGDITLLCQMIAGCATSAAAYLAGVLPETDNGADFLTWFYDWLGDYLAEKGATFRALRDCKRLRLGVVVPVEAAA